MSADNQEEAKGYSPAAPVTKSQSLTVLSSDADATSLPSGENATARTSAEWPSSVRRAAPVAESQSLTVSSQDADAKRHPCEARIPVSGVKDPCHLDSNMQNINSTNNIPIADYVNQFTA
jgi:hypothetical protein